MKEKVLLTGASGFLGSALAEYLVNNHYEVVGIGRKQYGFLTPQTLQNPNFKYLTLELKNLNVDSLQGFVPDTCIHLASMVEYASHDYHDYHDYTITPTLNLISIANKLKISKIIYSSTSSVIGSIPADTQLVDENQAVSPMSNYGLSKYVCEKLLEFASKKNENLTCIALRFPAIYGKNHLGGLVHTLKENALHNQEIELFGEGKYHRNILYIQDAIRAITLALKAKIHGFELFTIGADTSISTYQLATILIKHLNSSSTIKLSSKESPNPFNAYLDISKSKEMLKFNPTPVEQALIQYIQDIKGEK